MVSALQRVSVVACCWCGGFERITRGLASSVTALRASGHDVLYIAESDLLLR